MMEEFVSDLLEKTDNLHKRLCNTFTNALNGKDVSNSLKSMAHDVAEYHHSISYLLNDEKNEVESTPSNENSTSDNNAVNK